jgi:hypothetical protein
LVGFPSIVVSKFFESGIKDATPESVAFKLETFFVESALLSFPEDELLQDEIDKKANDVTIIKMVFILIIDLMILPGSS